MNDEARWPFRVLRCSSAKNTTALNNIEIYRSYIIFIRPQQDGGETKNLINQLRYLKTSFLLNPRAQFLFLISSHTPDMSSGLAFKILNASLKFMIVDVLLMIRSTYVTQNSANLLMSNENVNVSLINVFTLFPHARENNCSGVKAVVLLDTIFLNDSREFIYNKDSFKERSVNMYGCPVKVITYHLPPVVVDVSKGGRANCTGLEIDILLYILEYINATVTYSVRPLIKETRFARITALIEGLERGSADIAIGALPLFLLLTEYADATLSYFHTPIQWIVPCPKPIPRWGTMFNVFSLPVWLFLHSSLISVAIVMCVLPRYSEHPVYTSLQSCLLNAWGVALEISVPKMPQNFRVRFCFFLWVLVSLAFCIIFQVRFTTFLVNPSMERQIDTVDDLIASGIQYGYSEDFYDIVSIDDRGLRINRRQCIDIYGCLENTIKYGNFATISSAFHTAYYRANLSYHDRHLPVCKMKEDISGLDAVMYLTKGHHLLRRINEVIRKMVESGMMVKWSNDFLYTSRIHSRSVQADDYKKEEEWDSEYFVFTLFHLQTAFYILLIGYVLSTSTVFLELIYFKLQFAHPVYKPARKSLLAHFKRRLKNNQDRFPRNRYVTKNPVKLTRRRNIATAS
ncbi:hypothetical protein B7P43_G08335 [Cryptotermes secundus]|uniref:Ionotropic glutamate receptor C-terminal domain-containing protein n=1 Tax=Cryptotermes secundus TaxID=105785 RepID=A0A2J7RMX3_9NEOP|nr:hypothetical protein B7P43_G08335 [Cryptotermes secundus]